MTQENALKILKTGKNVFLTGSAGSGKTYILNKYLDFLEEENVPTARTASTGIASTHINGRTIHSWSGIGILETTPTEKELKNIQKNKQRLKVIKEAKVLVIDEISMLHKFTFEAVDNLLQNLRENYNSFGGLQVILCGDFFQLPPVDRGNTEEKERFCFMSKSWLNLNLNICYLTEQYRQKEGILNNLLNEIRDNNISNENLNRLNDKILERKKHEDILKLYTHNVDVDKINKRELDKIESKSKIFNAEVKGTLKLVESLKKSVLAPEELELKIGAKVLFVRNNYGKGYFNGTLGEVIDFEEEEDIPIIRTTTDNIIYANRETWSVEDGKGKTIASYTQIPLRLAWAITVHKSQGMTLDLAEVDLSKSFEKGQGYVGLSRLKSWEGLHLRGINEKSLEVSKLVTKADIRFRELSKIKEQELLNKSKKEVEEEIKNFISISKIKKKLKQQKIDTYQETKFYIEEGLSLEEISKKRDLNKSTIIGHIDKLKSRGEKLNLENLEKPNEDILNKVKKVFENLEDKESIKLKEIYEKLDEKISYDDIKLSLVFMD